MAKQAQPQPPNRIREIMQARRARGLPYTQDWLAEQLRCEPGTVSKLARGQMKLTQSWMRRISAALEVEPAELLPEQKPVVRWAELVGFVGKDDLYSWGPDTGKWHGIERVIAPPEAEGLSAVRVAADGFPVPFTKGALLYFKRGGDGIETDAVRVCIVQLRSGDAALKVVERGTRKGRFLLRSLGKEPDIEDAEIEWAAPIVWIRP